MSILYIYSEEETHCRQQVNKPILIHPVKRDDDSYSPYVSICINDRQRCIRKEK